MEELLDYYNKIQDLKLEPLLALLEDEIKEEVYCRYVHKNENLVQKHKNKIMLIKMQMVNLYRR